MSLSAFCVAVPLWKGDLATTVSDSMRKPSVLACSAKGGSWGVTNGAAITNCECRSQAAPLALDTELRSARAKPCRFQQPQCRIMNITTQYLLYEFLFYGNNAGKQHRKKGIYAYIIIHCARIHITIIALEFYEAIQNGIANDFKVTLVHSKGCRETEISRSCIRWR